jgi:hypothetical protein
MYIYLAAMILAVDENSELPVDQVQPDIGVNMAPKHARAVNTGYQRVI